LINKEHAATLKTAFADKWPAIATNLLNHLLKTCTSRDLKPFLESNSEIIKEGT